MFELFMYVYSRNALSVWFFAVDRALNSYFMIMIMIVTIQRTFSEPVQTTPELPTGAGPQKGKRAPSRGERASYGSERPYRQVQRKG